MKTVVFIIPTGIGCAIGGHAGDATPAAKLIAQTCDKLILHPNVVNASDINEMPNNALYVEGSILDRFLSNKFTLREVNGNRILVAVNAPIKPETVNAINAARSTIGADIEVMELWSPLIMNGWVENNRATGSHTGVESLIKQSSVHKFDALAIATPINIPEGIALEYFHNPTSRVNPWGGIEAIVSREVATKINKPVAHAPVECESTKIDEELFEILYNEIVDPRKAAEVCSSCYIHCVFKGLHKAPRIDFNNLGINRQSVIALVSPYGCIGDPHTVCMNIGIPVIAIRENTTAYSNEDSRIIYVDNYLEAAGVVNCISAGIVPNSVRNNNE